MGMQVLMAAALMASTVNAQCIKPPGTQFDQITIGKVGPQWEDHALIFTFESLGSPQRGLSRHPYEPAPSLRSP